ncbi:MAG: DUF4382 domain-containing protein [Planctomycetota bacterium]
MNTAPLALGVALASLPFVAACSSSSDDGNDGPATLTLALTDAASDELTSFCVDLESIRLQPANSGAMIGVLPQEIRVDLVTLTDVSQILNVVNVPAGLYSMAEITFDFTTAEAWLVGEATPATIFDGDGVALTGTVTLPITVAGAISAIASRNRVLELDFDLDQSVLVDAGTNAVFVEPSVVLRVDRSDSKELVVAGDIVSVDADASLVEVELQTLSGDPVRNVTVGVDATTVYQVDGVASLGATGLAALDALGAGTWVQLYGEIDPTAARLDAAYVEGGVGTYNGGSDIVQGHVVGRVGGAGANATLTVLGHSDDAAHANFQFNTLFTVSADFANSAVTARGTALNLDANAVNVGQRVRIFGSLSGQSLDASNGVLRLQPTRVLGFANSAPAAGSFPVDVSRIGLRDVADFTWSEGGTTPPDPDAMTINSSALTNGLGITANTPVEVRGFFPPIDDGNQDFIAAAVANLEDAPSLLVIADRNQGLTVTPTIGDVLTLGIAGTEALGEVAAVDQGFIGGFAVPQTPSLTVTGTPSSLGIYLLYLRSTGQASLHLGFADYMNALSAGIGLGGDIYNVVALGEYSGVNENSMSTGLMVISLD